MAIQVRALSDAEARELQRRAQSRTAPARVVERARLILAVRAGQTAPVAAAALGLVPDTGRLWVKRFNAQGLVGLQDRPRSGRPTTYTTEQVGQVVAVALTKPEALGLPFACWTLDRLATYLRERPVEAGGAVPISRAHIDRLLAGEGLRWRKEETWFGERVDPQFAAKRGPSNGCAPRPRRGVSSSIWTRWAPKEPRATLAGG